MARAEGIKLVWYSPIPYCIFNPVTAGLGGKSCACVDGILSVDPTGQWVYFSGYHVDGWEIERAAFAPTSAPPAWPATRA